MNVLETVIEGGVAPRRPLWLMRQAGRVLPEYRALKEKYSFLELSRDPDLGTEVTLLPFRRFPFDAAITFADIMSPLPALGVELDFNPGPVLEKPVDSIEAIDALREPAELPIEQMAPEVYEIQRRVRAELSQDRALLGFAGAPLTLAAYLIQGRGQRDFPALRAFVHRDPGAFSELLRKLTDLVIRYAIAQRDAGALAVQIFDSWAGLLSESEWRVHVEPHLRRLLEALGDARVPRILFLHSAPQLVDAYASLPHEVLSVDWRTDLVALRDRRPNVVLQGNLDPALLLAGAENVTSAARAFLRRMPRSGHIVNLGHGLLPTTPLEGIQALVDVVHSEPEWSQAQR